MTIQKPFGPTRISPKHTITGELPILHRRNSKKRTRISLKRRSLSLVHHTLHDPSLDLDIA